MVQPSTLSLLSLLALLLLHGHPGWAGRGSSSKKPSTSSKNTGSSSSSKGTSSSHKPVQGTAKKPDSSTKQSHKPNQYQPARGYPNQNPGAGGVNAGGNPNLYPPAGRNPSAGGYPNQNPGAGGVNPGGNPNLYPPSGRNPSAGGYPNQNPGAGGVNAGGNPNLYPPAGRNPSAGGYPNQNPGAGGVNAGGNPNLYPPAGRNPSAGGYPNQNPGAGGVNPGGNPNLYPPAGRNPPAGGYPNQNPGAGGVNPGGYPNQYPSAGGYPNQYPGRGGLNPGGYPNQYPSAGGYPNQYPGRGGVNPEGYPNQYPSGGRYPAGGGGYPSNKIWSPHYGGSYGYGGGSYGGRGSPFSRPVKDKGYYPYAHSKRFGKKAALAAGGGAVAGMAVGYAMGRISRPDFSFNSPQEQYYYNSYMSHRYGTQAGRDGRRRPGTSSSHHRPKLSSDDSSRSEPTTDYTPLHQSYNEFMDSCMKRTDLFGEKNYSSSLKAVAPLHINSTKTENQTVSLRGLQSTENQTVSLRGLQSTENQTVSLRGFQSTDGGFVILGTPTPGNGSLNITLPQGNTFSSTERPLSLTTEAGKVKDEDDDDTVSIVDIGYPELIEQVKVRRCVELYIAYSYQQEMLIAGEKDQPNGKGAQQHPLCQGMVVVLTTALTIMSSTLLLQ